MIYKKNKIIALAIVFFAVFILAGAGCTKAKPIKPASVSLQWWGVWNESGQVAPLIAAYQASHQYVKISYKKFRFEEFEDKLIQALAEDQGPDIISINNTWVKRFQSKILPMPDKPLSVAIGKAQKKGSSTEIVYTQATTPILSAKTIKDKFAPVVYGDMVVDGKIYALPLSIDSLVLIYNRSMLAQAKITKAPSSWQEVLNASPLVTLQDKDGKLTRSSAALGTANNIPRFFDVLSLLMMQSGSQMTNQSGKVASFHLAPGLASENPPAAGALEFYTNFANPNKESYTWNASMSQAVEAFASGQLAMMFGYAYHLPQLKAKAPGLDIGIAPIPQLDPINETNYANYWVEAPLKKTKYPDVAWDFIQFAASDEKAAGAYSEKTGRPPALRSLIDKYKEDPEKGVFALSALTAQNWYHGKNPAAAEDIFKEMINQVLDGTSPIQDALDSAAQRINQTF